MRDNLRDLYRKVRGELPALTEAEMRRYRSSVYCVAAAVGHVPKMSLAGWAPDAGLHLHQHGAMQSLDWSFKKLTGCCLSIDRPPSLWCTVRGLGWLPTKADRALESTGSRGRKKSLHSR